MTLKFTSLALAALALAPALASAGTIDFTGEIVPTTCVATPGSEALTVNLARIDADHLNADGAVAGHQAFNILLTCSTSTDRVGVQFENVLLGDGVTGNLKPASGSATNVQLSLFKDGVHQPINSTPTAWTPIVDGDMVLPYTVAYAAVGGAAGPGNLTSNATFLVVYE